MLYAFKLLSIFGHCVRFCVLFGRLGKIYKSYKTYKSYK